MYMCKEPEAQKVTGEARDGAEEAVGLPLGALGGLRV